LALVGARRDPFFLFFPFFSEHQLLKKLRRRGSFPFFFPFGAYLFTTLAPSRRGISFFFFFRDGSYRRLFSFPLSPAPDSFHGSFPLPFFVGDCGERRGGQRDFFLPTDPTEQMNTRTTPPPFSFLKRWDIGTCRLSSPFRGDAAFIAAGGQSFPPLFPWQRREVVGLSCRQSEGS